MSVKELKCPKCGASVSREKNTCDYCKAQYVIEERAVLFGGYEDCNTFGKLVSMKKEEEELLKKVKSDELTDKEIPHEREKTSVRSGFAERLLKACRVCHIKNCQFFNMNAYELLRYDWEYIFCKVLRNHKALAHIRRIEEAHSRDGLKENSKLKALKEELEKSRKELANL